MKYKALLIILFITASLLNASGYYWWNEPEPPVENNPQYWGPKTGTQNALIIVSCYDSGENVQRVRI